MEKENVKGRYFYLMLKDNFYDSDDMVLLESMENGYLYSNILLKLYLKSLKDKGKLMYKDRIPYNAEMLAKLTRHNVDVVRRAIEIFQQMGIIEILDNGAIFMLDIENYIGKSSTEADRRRAYDRRIAAEKQQLLLSEKSCEKSHEHIDIDIDLDLDKELKKDKKKKDTKHKYGEYQHVLLTDKEYSSLESEYGSSNLPIIITYLDEYLEMKGTKYKSHYMVIKKWAGKAAMENRSKESFNLFKNFLES